jgi:hypothetical protein
MIFLTYVLMCGLPNMPIFMASNSMVANIRLHALLLCVLFLHNAVIPTSLLYSLWQCTDPRGIIRIQT